jgi:hypothetical protein
MKEEENDDLSAMPDQPDTDLLSLLREMQHQLHLVEQKVDLLLSRSEEKSLEERPPHARPFERRGFPKQYRPRDNSHHHDKRERDRGPRDRDSVPGHFYERRPQAKGRRSAPGKKPFGFKRRDRE